MIGRMVRLLHALCLAAVSTFAMAQSSSPTGQCVEEFVQDYVLDDSVTYANVTPCPDADLNSTPAWPLRREEIHKEYSRDDFYTRLVKHDWNVDVEHARPNCVPVSRRVTRVYWKKAILPTAKCRAELYLMPIEATVPVGDQQITGRTTRLDLGATEARVDRSSWVMP